LSAGFFGLMFGAWFATLALRRAKSLLAAGGVG